MKKKIKIKDLTVSECKKICESCRKGKGDRGCRKCPLSFMCEYLICDYQETDLEREVKVSE